jgi:hypothetical protein
MDKTSGGYEMIKTEYLNDGTLIKYYSDAGYMLLQVETGIKYADPVDVVPCRYTYEETDELIEDDSEMSEIEAKAKAYDILVGVSE